MSSKKTQRVFQCRSCLKVVGHSDGNPNPLVMVFKSADFVTIGPENQAHCANCTLQLGEELNKFEVMVYDGAAVVYEFETGGQTTQEEISSNTKTYVTEERMKEFVSDLLSHELEKFSQMYDKEEKDKASAKQELHKVKYALLAMNERVKKLMESLLEEEEGANARNQGKGSGATMTKKRIRAAKQ